MILNIFVFKLLLKKIEVYFPKKQDSFTGYSNLPLSLTSNIRHIIRTPKSPSLAQIFSLSHHSNLHFLLPTHHLNLEIYRYWKLYLPRLLLSFTSTLPLFPLILVNDISHPLAQTRIPSAIVIVSSPSYPQFSQPPAG